jgi:hypothetical protein
MASIRNPNQAREIRWGIGLGIGLAMALAALGLGSCKSTADESDPDASKGPDTPETLTLPRLSWPGQQEIRPIAEVLQAPPPSNSSERVQLQGQVQRVAPFVGGQMYQLADSSGQIWILSNGSNEDNTASNPNINPLQPGDQVMLQGFPRYERIEIASQDWGEVYIEQEAMELMEPN